MTLCGIAYAVWMLVLIVVGVLILLPFILPVLTVIVTAVFGVVYVVGVFLLVIGVGFYEWTTGKNW